MKHKTPPRIVLPPTPRTDAAFALRHTKNCTIAHFRTVMEQLEYDLIAALKRIEELTKAKPDPTDRDPGVPSAKPKVISDMSNDELIH
jgi:hypothetical protein